MLVGLRTPFGGRLLRRGIIALTCLSCCAVGLISTGNPAVAAGPCNPVVSVIACENSLAGDAPSDWQVSGAGDATLQGFGAAMSVNVGETETFKIKSTAAAYHIDILRMGYYQGNGARKIISALAPTVPYPQSQPACLTNSATGLIDCGNWSNSASWTVPTTAVSGLYLAHLVRNDNGAGSLIPFVVRNDASHADVIFQTSDETWQAYNTYGGNSLYSCTVACPPGNPGAYKGAFKVSYNRPFHSAEDDLGQSWLMYAEYPMIRYLEQNGYDLSYTSGFDVDSRGPLLKNHKVFLSTGHDEYWSGNQRANVEAARDAGVNLAFFSGNEVFWKTRWEASTDGSNVAGRTLVTYKETHFDAPTDPQDPPTWTGTWEDPRFSPPADGGRPQNALTGQLFEINSGTADMTVPAQYARLRFWRNTAVAQLTGNQTITLAPGAGTVGYEWDVDVDDGFRPPGLADMSSTTVSGLQIFTDYGTNLGSGTRTHHLTLYRAASGALVFGAGTVQWSFGLDSANRAHTAPDQTMRQATVNLLADMGAQPATLIAGLVAATASTDTTAPISTISTPSPGITMQDGTQLTITGTASDSGGVVAGVEVSTDGGTSWHPATGTTSWSYTWTAHGSPSTTIRSRAVDDSGNLEQPGPGVALGVNCVCSLWGTAVPLGVADSGDGSSVEVGMKFTSDQFGTISALRFYKVSTNTGTHVGHLWTASGQLLASATFSGESASGWQTVQLSSPVVVSANTVYVASYFAPKGHYAQTSAYFYPPPSPPPDGGGSVDSAPLHALRSTGTTSNGLYTYSGSSAFPTTTFNGENYWVDVAFTPAAAPGQPTGVTAAPQYAAASLAWTPAATGGPATQYVITPYLNGVAQSPTTVSGSPAPTTALITGLSNGTTYTFTVSAANPNGSSPASDPSNPVTPTTSASAVVNGGFESGSQYWVSGGIYPPAISSTKPHTGTSAAVVGTLSGAEPSGDSSLSQTISVPASKPTLKFWYWPATTDELCTGSACQYDWQEAQIRSTSGATLASVFRFCSNAQVWTQVSYDMSAFAGQTVVLWFNVHGDGASPPDDTSMYLDDISVTGNVPTAPAVPTGVSAVAGNTTATVSWTAPADGGSPITSYTITPSTGGVAQPATVISGNPPATNVTIGGLTNGSAYTFTVTATNAIGTSSASAPSNPVTPQQPTAPGAPTGVTASAGNGTALVSWTAPANGGGAISSYTITPTTGGVTQNATVISGSPPATSTTITGLTNGLSYTFTVMATNAIGTGPASSPSNAVTPTATVPPRFVQTASKRSGSATSIALVPTSAVTTGNRIVALVGVWSGSNATAKTVVDSAGNTYTKLLAFTAPDQTEMSVWSAPVTAGGGTKPTITVTPTGRADVGVSIAEYAGLSASAGATVVDQQAHSSGITSGATTVSSGATAPTVNGNGLAIGFYVDSGFGDSLTGDASYSVRSNVSPTPDMETLIEDTPVGQGVAPSARVVSASSTIWLMATIVFKSS